MPSATPRTSSIARRSRCPTETFSAMTAAIGARNGRMWCRRSFAPSQDTPPWAGGRAGELAVGLRLAPPEPHDHQNEDHHAAEEQRPTEGEHPPGEGRAVDLLRYPVAARRAHRRPDGRLAGVDGR